MKRLLVITGRDADLPDREGGTDVARPPVVQRSRAADRRDQPPRQAPRPARPPKGD